MSDLGKGFWVAVRTAVSVIALAVCSGVMADPLTEPLGFDEIRDDRVVSFIKFRYRESVDIIDFLNTARNQDVIGACQSFAFSGVLENRVFQKFGVSLDLSERYQLYLNFSEFGTMGSSMEEIARFPTLIEERGVLPEVLYPYEPLLKNATRLSLDSAQGLDANSKPEIDEALMGLTRTQREVVAQEERFLGPLPNGGYPVLVPMRVRAIGKQSRFVKVLDGDREVPCFTTEQANDRVASLSAAEFARHCLEHTAGEYVHLTLNHAFKEAQSLDEVCGSLESRKVYASKVSSIRLQGLELALKNLLVKQSSLIALRVPSTSTERGSALWRSKDTQVVAGHAVVALGMLSSSDLQSKEEQSKGLLGSGTFDSLAKAVDPSYPNIDDLLKRPIEDRLSARVASVLGQAVIEEQGILVIRNSWGEEVGFKGYQALTYDYLLGDAGLMTLSVSIPPQVEDMGIKINMPSIKPTHDEQAMTIIEGICPKPQL